jgi:uncharacterized protein (TIGR00369 family)
MQMDAKRHFQYLEELYLAAPTNRYYQPQIQIGKESCEVIIPIREDFFHGFNATHGSVYFKALDDAAYFAAQSTVTDFFLVTVSFHLHFLRPIQTGEMRAVGKLSYSNPSHFVAEGILYDHRGREIGRGSGTFAKSKTPLHPTK